jgi:glyoxylase-like metal-dependent hydrolase (beta-lactamase superfamily II)
MLAALCSLLVAASCAGVPPPTKTPVTEQRPLGALLKAAAYPNSETLLALVTMQHLLATHREWEGYAYFGRLADEQPGRRALFRSLQASMQARVANDVPLWQRVGWIEDAIRKLDEGATADPLLGRFARGIVFAELPARFGKAGQAIEDLEACVAHRTELPLGFDRGLYRALAAAYRTAGDERRAGEMLARTGLRSLDDPNEPRVLGNISVDAIRGFRFGEKRFAREADGVYVAEGYDFANLAFIVAPAFVVAIDAGTTEETAREAVAALRRITQAPIKYVILTHGHWDHVGGLGVVREPGSTVIARAGFPEELGRSRASPAPFHYFFGTGTLKLDAKPNRLIDAPETIADGGLDLRLIPAKSGETSDALFVEDRQHGLLFVGDAFMPYVGAPFVAEGSVEGYLGAIAMVLDLHPRRLIHGHLPLTATFTIEAMPGLRDAMAALYTTSCRTRCARRRPRCSRTWWRAIRSFSASTPSMPATGTRTATASTRSPAPNGRPRSTPSAGAVTRRSHGHHATSRRVATRRSPCRSPISGSFAIRRAPPCARAARVRSPPCGSSTPRRIRSASLSTRSGRAAGWSR